MRLFGEVISSTFLTGFPNMTFGVISILSYFFIVSSSVKLGKGEFRLQVHHIMLGGRLHVVCTVEALSWKGIGASED